MNQVENPRDVLKRFMENRKLNMSTLSRAINVPRSRIHRILKGKMGISTDTALRLGRVFENDASFWQKLQSEYEISKLYPAIVSDLMKIDPVELKQE